MSGSTLNNARAAALEALLQVLRDGRSLDQALMRADERLSDPRDRGLCRALSYGVLREHRRLSALREHLLRSSLRERDQDIALLIELGLYQLLAMEVPAHAAVSATVAIAHARKKAWAAKLINAVLRRFQREQDSCLAAIDASPAVRWSLPDWLVAAHQSDWPDDYAALCAAHNARAPMTLRANARHQSAEALIAELAKHDIAAHTLTGFADALVLDQPVGVDQLPAFAAGDCSVQDGAAQLAADALALAPGQRVLDACAAPGGKTAHILERCAVTLTALDNEPARLARVSDALERLGLNAHCQLGDAGRPSDWWDGQPFDRILLDAPCSGSGVIRRHPDIKWLRRASDIERLQAGQMRLLAALWSVLAPGGRLVYATCSVLNAENEAVIEQFMATHSEARAVSLSLPVGRALAYGRQILTGEAGVDGFYYACLEKH